MQQLLYYVIFSQPLLPYTDYFASPFSSEGLHAVYYENICNFVFFIFLIFVHYNNKTPGMKHCYDTTVTQL